MVEQEPQIVLNEEQSWKFYGYYGFDSIYGPVFIDVLFGVPMKDSGIKRFFIRNRQRVISFAVTLVFDKYNAG